MGNSKINRRMVLKSVLFAGCGLLIPGSAKAGNIHSLKGSVFINKERAHPGSIIQPGDLVTTSHNGRITFSVDGDAFLLKPFTSLKVESSSNVFIDSLRLLTGQLLSVFKTGRSREIVTATATIGIRGTGCFLNVKPKTTYYCNCYGKTDLRAPGINESFEAVHHSAHVLDTKGSKVMGMRATEVIDHTDDELRELEALVGRVPKFDQ
ncbi:MAG: hypothetical protein ACI845_003021 [Gammaproteobacteria bacterium]|jgi:hypothetical protein